MSKKVRVGIVGTSGWADFMYLSASQSHPQVEITAICGRNRGPAEQLASKYNIPNIFTDYKDMISQGGLQAIIIGSALVKAPQIFLLPCIAHQEAKFSVVTTTNVALVN